ncbi:MAG: hypothetical protein HYV09_35280 [Deltaproteobacteria bacterium]|nr:hypothetical protein [Deltaproteobacteria bacterium]
MGWSRWLPLVSVIAGLGCTIGAVDDGGPLSPASEDAAPDGALDALPPDAPGDVQGDAPADAPADAPDPDAATDAPADGATPDTTPPDPIDELCKGFATSPFDPPAVCDGPSGTTSTEIPSNDIYSTSWFGCYRKSDGTIYKDPYDNCEFACGPKGLCSSSLSGPECQAELQWFAADADRYGCGARVRVTNCVNRKQVVLATLDRGPNCKTVEKAYGAPVLDMSHPAMAYLFDGKEYGGSDKKRVIVEKVPATTALGPVK